MAIADNRAGDLKDMTTEHLERVAKGKKKLAVQMNAIFGAFHQLKAAADSRTYFYTPEQWAEALNEIRGAVDEFEHHLRWLDEKRRGPRTWERR